ncbi:sugar phosphate isomerase/epimerase family protein [Streptomyces sp. NPDC059917]|uniref:sugar phosphate isomerase/epimerase family protein n=1 Tax=Streptomyces sp. NPDC059917 TaxID=3347002 RepID=UPI00365198A8
MMEGKFVELSLNRAVLNPQASAARVVRSAHGAGFRYIEMSAHRLKQATENREARSLLRSGEILPVHGGWSLRLNWERKRFTEGLAAAEGEMAFAAQWGSRSGALILPQSFSGAPDGISEEDLLDRIGRTADVARRNGLALVLEYIGIGEAQPKAMAYGTLAGALRVVRLVGRSNVGVLLDSYHWYTSDGAIGDIALISRDTPLFVHLNDAPAGDPRRLDDTMRELPGSGVIDLLGFLGALSDIGYQGPVSIELKHPSLHAMAPESAAEEAYRAGMRVLTDMQTPRQSETA